MSSIALQIVEEKIAQDTNECVERHKKTDIFTKIFNSRQSYRPKCRAAAINKFQAEYDAAQNALLDNEANVDAAFSNELKANDIQSVTKYVILAVITAAIITLIIKL